MDDHAAGVPRLYSDLAWLWPLVSPPESYPEEVATFVTRFRRHGVADGARVLHLGSGGGSIDFHLKQKYDVTGIDLSDVMVKHACRLNPEVEYHVGDIRTHRLDALFDAVLV
ncbi:MAG: class I SAM-dependent methyltransferase, partial [Longimicrobiales bacterium]